MKWRNERGETETGFSIGMMLFIAIIIAVFLLGGSIAGELAKIGV